METLFRIGEVAEMCNGTIRTLRLYDKMGLFKPSHVDSETGYRYYTADQLPLLNTILVLKSIGFHLLDIKSLVDHGMAADLLLSHLSRRQEELENEMEIARFKLENAARIREAVLTHIDTTKPSKSAPQEASTTDEAFRLSRLICLENLKVEHVLSEALWL